MTIRTAALLASLALATIVSANVVAQTGPGPGGYPSKPVKIIVPYGPGGAADLLARTVGERLAAFWSQPVIVENRVGASGNIGIEALVRSAPDGYTLGVIPVSNLAVNPHLYATKLSYDVFRDLSPISLIAQVQNVLVVGPGSSVQGVKDLIQAAKAQPGKLSFSSPGVGSQAHIAGAMLESLAGITMLHVPYGGVGAAIRDVMGGQVTMMFAQLPAALPLLGTGKAKILAIASGKRSAFMPQVPTILEETGIGGFDAVSWSALMSPAGTAEDLRNFAAGEVARALKVPEVIARLQKQGAEPVGSTPAELSKAMKDEHHRYGEIIRKAKITVD